jgi:hypothetical protein
MPLAQLDLAGGGGKAVAVGHQQHGPGAFGQSNGDVLFAEPAAQSRPGVVIDDNADCGSTSLPDSLLR